MPRRAPSTKIDIIGNLDLSPEEAAGDYLTSKAQEKYFVKPPNWDSPGDSIELLYIQNIREHDGMLKLQSDLLDSAKRQSKTNLQRVRQLYQIQDHLRKRFIEVNHFMKECAEKQRCAEKAVTTETKLHSELGERIENYKNSINDLETFRQSLKSTVEEFEPYERVLNEVVKKSKIFASPKDCMDRCDALMLAQVEISKCEQIKITEIENMRKQMVKLTNEAALTVLGLKNDLAKLDRSYNLARALVLKWEKLLSITETTIVSNKMNKERTYDGIQELCRVLCKRQDEESNETVPREDPVKAMDFIKHEIDVLMAVIKEFGTDKSYKSATKTYVPSGGGLC